LFPPPAVRRRLAGLGPKGSREIFEDFVSAAHVTGRTVTNGDDVLSARGKGELRVEGGNAVDPGLCDAEVTGNLPHGFLEEIIELALHVLEKRNEACGVRSVASKHGRDSGAEVRGVFLGMDAGLTHRSAPCLWEDRLGNWLFPFSLW
jgi:hypothetical protein